MNEEPSVQRRLVAILAADMALATAVKCAVETQTVMAARNEESGDVSIAKCLDMGHFTAGDKNYRCTVLTP
ncbi:MAG: hypothetical protein O7G88_08050 [bacterium]|nr:hypothetical protein [bacterium]